MAKRRPSGDGMVRKRDDGRWEGRIVVGHKDIAELGCDGLLSRVAGDQVSLLCRLQRAVERGVDAAHCTAGQAEGSCCPPVQPQSSVNEKSPR